MVQSMADLPELFQQVVKFSLKPSEQINSIIVIPRKPFLKRGGTPYQVLLSTSRGMLHLQERVLPGKPPIVTYLPGEALLYAHHSLLLLYGRIELVGEVNTNLVRIIVEYNTVGEDLLEAVLKQFLRFTYCWTDTDISYHPQSDTLLDALQAKSFKFMNGLRLYALQPGEKLLGFVFQPRITKPALHFFRRPIAPEALLALTDKAVIIIEEDKAWGAAYGWLITLCPRKFVTDIEVKPNQEWNDISVHLQRNGINEVCKMTLENETAQALENLWLGQNND